MSKTEIRVTLMTNLIYSGRKSTIWIRTSQSIWRAQLQKHRCPNICNYIGAGEKGEVETPITSGIAQKYLQSSKHEPFPVLLVTNTGPSCTIVPLKLVLKRKLRVNRE